MGGDIAAGELAKDVDGAEQMIKEHNERKVCSIYCNYGTYVHDYNIICT